MSVFPFLLAPLLQLNESLPVFICFELDQICDVENFSLNQDEDCLYLVDPDGNLHDWWDSVLPFSHETLPPETQRLELGSLGLMEAIIQVNRKDSNDFVNYKWRLNECEFGALNDHLKTQRVDTVYVFAEVCLDVQIDCNGVRLMTRDSYGGDRTCHFKLTNICQDQNISEEIEENLTASAIGVSVDEFGESSAEWCDELIREERGYLDLSGLVDSESEDLAYGDSLWEMYGNTQCGVVDIHRLAAFGDELDKLLSVESEMSSCAVVVLRTQVKVSIDLSIEDDL